VSSPAFLWQADSDDHGSRGVCGEQADAQRAAEKCMTGEGATRALIRAVTPELEVGGLDDGWCPTGDAWLGEPVPGGGVMWVPVTMAEIPAEPDG
jgi:hypothetical protein